MGLMAPDEQTARATAIPPAPTRQSTPFRQRDRRALLVGIIGLACILVVPRAVGAWRSWEQRALERASALADERAQSDSLSALSPALRDSLVARTGALAAADSLLLDGDTPAALTASLAATITEAAASATVQLGPLQVSVDSGGSDRSVASRAPILRVVGRFTATGDTAGLLALLSLLEEPPPLLTVRELAVTHAGDRVGAPAPMLQITLVVEGLARRSPKSGHAAIPESSITRAP